MIAHHVIDSNSKRPDAGEIIVTLFEYCDLDCIFCTQDHDSFEGIGNIPSKIEEIKFSIQQLIKKGKKKMAIHIMGGELFSDQIPDKAFEDYKELNRLIYEYCAEIKFPVEISYVTNFVWTKKDRIKKFLADVAGDDIKLLTSYDPAGRFNASTFEIYKSNVIEFKDHISSVNVIMTKQNNERFMKNQVPFFDYLYENFDIYFDYYGPGKNHELLMATDVELREFMKFMYDNWNKCHPFKTFSNKSSNKMSCMDTYTVMPDGKWGGCGFFEGIDKVIPIKLVTEQSWFDSYNCFECEHFQRCSMGCFMSNHVKDMRTQQECWLKEVYDYVDSNKESEK